MPPTRRIGVLLAAGRGGRMGGTKQLTIWQSTEGPKPLVCAAYDAIRPICDDMVVVLGHAADEVTATLAGRPFHGVTSDPSQPMFESARSGIRHALSIDASATIVLQLGDHPQVDRATLEILSAWSRKRPAAVVIPRYHGRGGHPIFIPARVAVALLDADCPAGLGQYWAENPELCRRISVPDTGVVRDVDTPDDLP